MSDFIEPDWNEPIDPEARIAATPEENVVRGMFVMDLVKTGRSVPEGVDAFDNYIAFKNYQVREHMRVAVKAADLAHPGVPYRQAFRLLGRVVYTNFLKTMAGAAIFAVAGKDYGRVTSLAPKAYNVAHTPGSVESQRIGDKRVEVQMRDIYNFPECLQVGVWEGAMDVCNVQGRILVRKISDCDVDYLVEWE